MSTTVNPPTSETDGADESTTLAASATMGSQTQSLKEKVTLAIFIAVPFLAILAAVPVALRGGWLGWSDVVLMVLFYVPTALGITVGYHRLFTHKSFKPKRWLKITLAVAGSMAVEGPVVRWVADHRKHHKFSDSEGDPHSPWIHGPGAWNLTKGLYHAHVGWLFESEQTPAEKYAPDLLKDRDLVLISRHFWASVLTSLLLPAVLGGLMTWSWHGAATAFFWAGLVRIGLLHHVTWSINSICHTIGDQPFNSRDKAANVWWLAIPSMGESWHNLHHADPTCARHGVLKGQIDISARTIWLFERFGWARDVRWPKAERLDARRAV